MEVTEVQYKESEIGVIPVDWEVHNIIETSTLKARIGWQGLTTAEYLSNGDYFLVTGTDFSNGRIQWDACNYVDKERYIQDTNIQIKVGDILITKDGTIGKIAFIDNLPKEGTLNSGVFVIRPKGNTYLPIFLFYIFNSFYFNDFLRKLVAGSTITHLYQKDFISFKFPLPSSKLEQTAIATALSDTDALIENLEKLIAKKRNIKQGVMQELLTGRKRLAGFNGEWMKIKLGDICDIRKGQLITEKTAAGGEFPVIAGGINPSYFHNRPNRGKNTITISASGANAGYVSFHRNPIFASDCSTIEEKGTFNIVYIFFLLQLFQKKIFKLQTGGAQPHVYPEHLKPLELVFPQEVTEQDAIANILIDIDEELSGLEKQMNKYQLIKQGMMQTLLTGKIRLV